MPSVDTTLIMILRGIRLSELLNIKLAGIFNKDWYFIVTNNKTAIGKNHLIPINPKTEKPSGFYQFL